MRTTGPLRSRTTHLSEWSPQRWEGEPRHECDDEDHQQRRRSCADRDPSDGKPAALLACSLDLIERHRPEHDADDGNRDCENVQQNAEHDARDRGDQRPDGQPIGLMRTRLIGVIGVIWPGIYRWSAVPATAVARWRIRRAKLRRWRRV